MKLVKTLMLAALVPGVLASKAFAYDCSSVAQYVDGSSYATGAIVKNAGSAYQCTVGGWCTVGGPYAPGSGWAWTNAWSGLGACSGTSSSSVSSSSSVVSSSSVSSSSSSVVSSTSSSVTSSTTCSGVSEWSSSAVYTGGMQASYNGVKYQAKWWTQGQNPATNSGPDGVWAAQGTCGASSSISSSSSVVSSSSSSSSSVINPGGKKVVGYFAEWGVYGRNYHVKNIETSGAAAKLTHIVYAFGNVQNGQCVMGDSYADIDRAYSAAESVDGVADSWESTNVRGSFGQLRRLKAMHPGLKVIWSFGGWTWSGGFTQAAANPTAFANSCYNLVKDSRWADVMDGIDIDWEYPNNCGLQCDSSGFAAYKNLMAALRAKFGSSALVTSAIGAGEEKINSADYAGAAQYVDWYMPMTYDFFGAWDKTGPTAPHSPLYDYAGMPIQGYSTDHAIQVLKAKGIPSSKLLLGVGFYGRGWTGVTQSAPGGSATGAAAGTYEAGIEDYKVLKTKCTSTVQFAGTAYAKCGSDWWSFDTPQSLVGKMDYVNQQNLGGTFFWELSGDTANGELINVLGTIR